MKYDVFISYSSKDKIIADGICHTLEEYGIMCWIAPRDVTPGERYAREIIRGIRESKIMVIVYSKYANQSEHVANEIDRAFNEGKTIIPFMIDNTPMNDDFNYYLARKHWLIAYPNFSSKYYQLALSVALVVGKNLSNQTVVTNRSSIYGSMRIRKNLYIRKIGEEYIVMGINQDLEKTMSLNESAYFLWSKLQTKLSFSLSDMVKFLTEEYDVNVDIAQNDCKILLEGWEKANLIEFL